MKLTKFEHSCMVIQKGDSSIVITHEHADHWTEEQLTRILDRNKNARIFGPAGVVAAAPAFTIETVSGGDEVVVEPFSLKFFGEKHAVIHSSIPLVDNVGVMVDDTFYYGGDSFTLPGVEVGTLAVPVGAPWLKIGEVIDYVEAVKPRKSLPVHEAVLSVVGRTMANGRVEAATTRNGGEFFPLEFQESLEL